MKSQMDLQDRLVGMGRCANDRAIEPEGRVAQDLFLAFDPDSGRLTEAAREEVRHWSSMWLPAHPGAVVVMGCNGKARNNASDTRQARLQALSTLLAECGVPEDRIRYTDEVLDLQLGLNAFPPERGVLCIRVLRSAALDAAVMPISELFLSLTAASTDDESPRP